MGALLLPRPALAEPLYAVELIPGAHDGGRWQAGIRIGMEPGWKTYWRMPGDAGIPPSFDWTGSQNVAEITALFPAPSRFEDQGGEAVGYKSAVLFPVMITPADAAQPVTLSLNLFFAVCKDVCIPAKANPALTLTPGASASESFGLIASALASVPKPGSAITSATAVMADQKPALAISLVGDLPPDLDIFVEGGGLAYFRAPRLSQPQHYVLPVTGITGLNELKGQTLTITIVGSGLALEQTVTVG